MQARLILNSPDNAERELKLSLPATVGRGRDAKVKLIHSKVSRTPLRVLRAKRRPLRS